MTRLSVNLNKIALVRNARAGDQPSLLEFGRLAIEAGCHGLTVHPRPDQRHIRVDDLSPLSSLCSEYGVEFNIEGNPFSAPNRYPAAQAYPGFMALIRELKPQQCTLVPDSESQLTSDHGFDPVADRDRLSPVIAEIRSWGVRVSLFLDPLPEKMAAAAALRADRIELYTGPYANAHGSAEQHGSLATYREAAVAAAAAGLGINAGHDLDLHNLSDFVRSVPQLLEVSIGHALTVDALKTGMTAAVKAYLSCLK